MSTWWRQSRDASGMTITDRLEKRERIPRAYDIQYVRRIRSILRRLKICPHCRGKKIVPMVRVSFPPSKKRKPKDYTWGKCPVCGGKGTVSFDTKEGTQDARTN